MIPNVIAAKVPHRDSEVVGDCPPGPSGDSSILVHSAGSEPSQARPIKHLLKSSSLLSREVSNQQQRSVRFFDKINNKKYSITKTVVKCSR